MEWVRGKMNELEIEKQQLVNKIDVLMMNILEKDN